LLIPGRYVDRHRINCTPPPINSSGINGTANIKERFDDEPNVLCYSTFVGVAEATLPHHQSVLMVKWRMCAVRRRDDPVLAPREIAKIASAQNAAPNLRSFTPQSGAARGAGEYASRSTKRNQRKDPEESDSG
ncbi:hypothetical protein AVEN_90306-1, partial [Araneus ventricosus]